MGRIIAAPLVAPNALPEAAIALRDGWAVAAQDTVGATPYGPCYVLEVPLQVAPGDLLPPPADAVLPPEAVQGEAVPFEILGSVAPGEGMRRAGQDFEAGAVMLAAGEKLRPDHIAFCRLAGIETISLRVPKADILTRSDLADRDMTGPLLADLAAAEGAAATITPVDMRDAQALSLAIADSRADFILIAGGTGFGATDHSAEALRPQGEIIAHGLAVRPGETMGCGIIKDAGFVRPVILVPGRVEAALAAWLLLARPCLRQLAGALDRAKGDRRSLTRKIVSAPGMSDLVLLRGTDAGEPPTQGLRWEPLATGDIPWNAFARAEAWLVVPPESEGYAQGEQVYAEFM
jgi:molybdopterin biosynthesis enzyme